MIQTAAGYIPFEGMPEANSCQACARIDPAVTPKPMGLHRNVLTQ